MDNSIKNFIIRLFAIRNNQYNKHRSVWHVGRYEFDDNDYKLIRKFIKENKDNAS